MDITAVPPGFAPKGAHLWDSSKSLPLITGASVAAYSQGARLLWGTLLTASNKALAGNGAARSALLVVQADCSGASYPQRDPHRLAPPAGSLKADKCLT